MLLRVGYFLLSGFLLVSLAHAAKPEEWTETELNMAAPYCIDTQQFRYGNATWNPSPRASYWVSLMGKEFWSMHHYCWALVNLARAERASTPEDQRLHLRKSAIDDIKYVINNARDDFIMLPELYTRMGSVHLLLRNPRKAEQAFKAAIAAKPDYWPPYVRWAEYLMNHNGKAEAKKIVRSGLENAPQAKTLLQLWKELGGGALPAPVNTKSEDKTEEAAKSEPAVANVTAKPESETLTPTE